MRCKMIEKFSLRNLSFYFSILLLVFLVSCERSSSQDSKIDDSSQLVKINGTKVTVGQLKKKVLTLKRKFHLKNKEPTPEENQVLNVQAMNELIKNELFRQEISKAGLSLSPEELEKDLLEETNGYSEKAFSEYIESSGLSRKDWENNLKFNLLTNKLILLRVNSKVKVDDEQLRSYFESNGSEFSTKEQVRALHIMVKTEREAQDIQNKLKSKGNKFSDLARRYSVAPEGAIGGDLGYFEAGQMLEEFDSVFKLKKGKTSEIIKTPYGYHLFKVVDKKEGRKMTFEESRTVISNRLLEEKQNAAFNKWLNDLKEQADIQIFHENFAQIF